MGYSTMFQEGELVKLSRPLTLRTENYNNQVWTVAVPSSYGVTDIDNHTLGIYVGTVRMPSRKGHKMVMMLHHLFLFNTKRVIINPEYVEACV
jgi:hypothetical protein